MADVKGGRAVLQTQIPRVNRRCRFARRIVRPEVARVVIERFAEGVRSAQEDALTVLVFRRQHQPVVIGIANGFGDLRIAETGVGKDLFVRCHGTAPGRIAHNYGWLVHVNEDAQATAGASLVIGFNGKLIAQSPLYAKVVLVQIRAS